MKQPRPHYLVTLFAALLSASALAQTATVGTPEFDPLGEHLDLRKQIRIILECVEMPHEEFTKLMEPARRGADDGDLRKKAKKLIKKDKARVLETMTLTTTAGQRAKTESVLEKIYPTEWDPPEATPRSSARNGSGKKGAGEAVVTPPNPTAFDIRDTGSTMEVEPNIDADGVTISLNIAPELVYYSGEDSWGTWKTPDAETEVSQPRFYVMKVQTNACMIAGKYHLLTALSPQDEGGNTDTSRKVVMFVRSDILLVGK